MCVSKDLPTNLQPIINLASWIAQLIVPAQLKYLLSNYDLLMEQAFEDIRDHSLMALSVSQPFFDGHALSLMIYHPVARLEDPRFNTLEKHGLLLMDSKSGVLTIEKGGNSCYPFPPISSMTRVEKCQYWP